MATNDLGQVLGFSALDLCLSADGSWEGKLQMAECVWEWNTSTSLISFFLESCLGATTGHFAGKRWLVGAIFPMSCRQVPASLNLHVPGSCPQSCPPCSFSVESVDILQLLFPRPFLLHPKEVSGSFVFHFLKGDILFFFF